MSHFNHLVIALPIENVGIIAKQAGLTPPSKVEFDEVEEPGTPTGDLFAALEKAIAERTGLTATVFTNYEYDEDNALYGVELHSTYTDKGIAEAQRATALFGGYVISTPLWARAQAIKSQLVKAFGGFAAADLMVIEQHW